MTTALRSAPTHLKHAGIERIPRSTRVLVVDDDPALAECLRRALAPEYDVETSSDVANALAAFDRSAHDVVVSDLTLPGASGLALLEALRARDEGLPFILLTGDATIETAAEAMVCGAFRYLLKPLQINGLREAIRAAVTDRAQREEGGARSASLRGLSASFARALESLHVDYQPIVCVKTRRATWFEALIRSGEPDLPTPTRVLEAAETLGELTALGRRVRNTVATQLDTSTAETIFVNLHPKDLFDDDLCDPNAALAKHSARVVFEVTERASLDEVGGVEDRIAELRRLGYRIALGDLGAGYAGLSFFARLRPEIAKIDMCLVRSINADPVRQRVVSALVTLAAALDVAVVAEGVETIAERDAVAGLGCTHVQGYELARPGSPFPQPTWRQ